MAFNKVAIVLAAGLACASAFQGAVGVSSFRGAAVVESVSQLATAPRVARGIVMDGKSNLLRGRIQTVKNTKKVSCCQKLPKRQLPYECLC
jgi:hypothetical protein